jgi:hypothetical protein
VGAIDICLVCSLPITVSRKSLCFYCLTDVFRFPVSLFSIFEYWVSFCYSVVLWNTIFFLLLIEDQHLDTLIAWVFLILQLTFFFLLLSFLHLLTCVYIVFPPSPYPLQLIESWKYLLELHSISYLMVYQSFIKGMFCVPAVPITSALTLFMHFLKSGVSGPAAS